MTEYWFYESQNGFAIRQLLKDEDIKSHLFLNPPENFGAMNIRELNRKKIIIYIVRVDSKLAGLGVFQNFGDYATVDTAFFKEYRGKHANILAKKVILDYLSKYSVRALKAKIRKTNKRSLIFALWNKFKVVSQDDTYFYVEREHHGRFS